MARDPLRNGHPAAQGHIEKKQNKKKYKGTKKNFERGKIKKGLSLRILPRSNSFDDKTCIRSRHITVQMSFGQAR